MAKFRALMKRRKSVQNICKITRTMQLISTARFQRAFNRATSFRPYSDHISAMVADVSRHATLEHPLLRAPKQPKRVAVMIITANRGLCGGYNNQVLQRGMKTIREQQGQNVEIELAVVGKKGLGYMKFAGMKVDHPLQLGDEPTYEAITDIARDYRNAFMEKKIDGLYVVYMRFHSTSKQSAEVMRVLPASAETNHNNHAAAQSHGDFEFTPTAEELLKELLPESVTVSLYQCFIDAVVSEHVSRMVAMKAATDNANDMIKQLGRLANRARQTQITSELSELIGGAEGLK